MAVIPIPGCSRCEAAHTAGPGCTISLSIISPLGAFCLHGLILCVSEGVLSGLLCAHIVDIGTFDLHGLILCVSGGVLCELICVDNVGIETFDLHGPTFQESFLNPL